MATKNRGALRATARLAALALVTTFAACGGGGGGNDTPITYDNHLPMHMGDRWVYRERGTGGTLGTTTSISTETVVETRDVSGTPYYILQTRNSFPYAPWSLRQYAASASGIQARYGIDSPPKDLVRFPTYEGASFVQDDGPSSGNFDQDFDGKPDPTTYRATTTIVGVETLSTPAGVFSGALHVRDHSVSTTRMSSTGTDTTVSSTLDTWYVPGVGRARWEYRYDGGFTFIELMRHVPAGRPDPDTTPPVLVRVAPPSNAGAPLALTFNEPVTDFRAVTVTLDGNPVELGHAAPYDPEGRSVNLFPLDGWHEGTYTVRIAEGIQDFAGNTMAALPDSTFTMSSDFSLISALPPRFAVDVDHENRPLTASMNKLIDLSTLTAVRLRENGAVVPATVSYEYGNLKVTPATPLKPATRYAVDLHGLRSDAGLALTNPQDWTFTTGATLKQPR
jgi:hypothetical protein